MLRFFREYHHSSFLVLTLLAVALWVRTAIEGQPVAMTFDGVMRMPLYALLMDYLPLRPWALLLMAFVVLNLLGIGINLLNNRYALIGQITAMPAMLYVLLCSALPAVQRFNPALIAAALVLLAMHHLMATYHQRDPLDHLFRAALDVGLAALFYAPAALLLLWVYFALLVMRPFRLREWLVPTLGALLPFGIHVFYLFMTRQPVDSAWGLLWANLITPNRPPLEAWPLLVAAGCIGVPLLVAWVYLLPSRARQKLEVRNYMVLIVGLLVLLLAAAGLLPGVGLEVLYIAALPATFILANLFKQAALTKGLRLLFGLFVVGVFFAQAWLLTRQLWPLLGAA